MRRTVAVAVIVLLGTTASQGEAPGSAADAQRIAEIQAQMMAGKTKEAVGAARAFIKTVKDDAAKTDALQIVAAGLRKSGDWKGAVGAYRGLCKRYEQGSDEYVRFDAIAEVLAGSKDGVYTAGGTIKVTPGAEAAKLSDDAALDEALAVLAKARCSKLKARGAAVRRARSPKEVMKVFGPIAEEARQVFLLGPNTPPDDVRAVGKMAAARLSQLHTQVTAVLRKRLQGYQKSNKFRRPWSFTNVEKKDIKNANSACKDMAASERDFQTALANVAGAGDWPEGDSFRAESGERAAAYEQLAGEFVVPAYTVEVF